MSIWFVAEGRPIAAASVMAASLLIDGASVWMRDGLLSRSEPPSSSSASPLPSDRVPLLQAIDHLPGVFYVIGPSGRLLRWNARFESVSGYSADELRGRQAHRFFEGDDRRRVAEAVLRVFGTGDTQVEAAFITKDGEALPMLFSGSRIVIDGHPYLIGMGIDVTDRIAAEEALSRREMEYRMLTESMIDVVSLHDADMTRRYVSPSIEDLAGYTPEALIGRNAFQVIHPDDRESVRASLHESLKNDEVARVTYRIRHKDGSWIWVESISRYIETDRGEQRLVSTTRDVSRQNALEQQLRDALAEADAAREEAERAERMKSLFLANMSHEIRTPLTSIIGFSEILAGEVSAPFAGMAELVGKSGQRLLNTIDSVLALSKLEAGRWKGDLERIALNDEVRTTVALMRPQSEEQGVPIHVDVPDEPVVACVDRAGLERVIDNLLSNAIKFSPHGRPVHVRVRHNSERDEVMLEVEDDGPGIPESQQHQLFKPFTHMGSERDARTGAGLGLSIAHRFARRMNGRIDIDSARGEGTRMIVTFPTATSSTEPASLPGDKNSRG